MQHDISTGLVHFTDRELNLTGEKRSPIDYRAMPMVALQVRARADACAHELIALYSDHEDGMISDRPYAIQRLRTISEELEGLAIGTQIVADLVEIEAIQTIR